MISDLFVFKASVERTVNQIPRCWMQFESIGIAHQGWLTLGHTYRHTHHSTLRCLDARDFTHTHYTRTISVSVMYAVCTVWSTNQPQRKPAMSLTRLSFSSSIPMWNRDVCKMLSFHWINVPRLFAQLPKQMKFGCCKQNERVDWLRHLEAGRRMRIMNTISMNRIETRIFSSAHASACRMRKK